MAEAVFIELAIILLSAFLVSYIIRLFNQPIIIGYIFAGMIISPFILNFGASKEIVDVFSSFGVAFLLFIVGLHLNPKVIKDIGAPSLLIGLGQMALTFALGFSVSLFLLGFGVIPSAYIGVALMFSSTIIIMKLLSDKRQLDTLFGKISIGILIIQDLAAVAILMFISSVGNVSGTDFLVSFVIRNLLVGGIVLFFLFLVGFLVLPTVIRGIAKSQELLFLFSVCWFFLISALFAFLGFSVEIGALVAGVVLSVSPYSTEISSKVRPLRDFFLIIFFIILGLNIQFNNLNSIVFNAIIFSAIALVFKPLILMSLMAVFGYTKRNNFLVGTTLAQISEFSLIVLALGVSVGHITSEIISTLTLTVVITITLSTYMIMYSNKFYKKIYRFVSFFEKKNVKERREVRRKYEAILFGYNRIGFDVLRSLKKIKNEIVDSIRDIAKKSGILISGPIPLPTKKLKITTRKSPCGDGTATFDNFEMRIHKRLIDLPTNEKVLHHIMRLKIPKSVNIKIEMKD